jgi:hypothetical protein
MDGSPATFRFDETKLMSALPATYRGKPMDRLRYFIDFRTSYPRDDPWNGQPVSPESCRQAILVGVPPGGIDGFRSDTPAVTANLNPPTPVGDGLVNVRLYELTGAEAVRYQRQLPRPAPECRRFTVGSAGRGSIVERALPEFGPSSRYVVRTYPVSGRTWTERILQLQTPRFALEVRLYGTDVSERELLTFARQTRALAVRKLD